MDITSELKSNLLDAKSTEEVVALAKEAGRELSEEEAKQLWRDIEEHRNKPAVEEFSAEELETVSGGARDWLKDGCAATVEPGSDCWFSNDFCYTDLSVPYEHKPVGTCPKCGSYMYLEMVEYQTNFPTEDDYYRCRSCGYGKKV